MAAKLNREQIALDLLISRTNSEVCKKHGISESTLYRLKQEESFKEHLEKQKKALFGETMQKAQAYSLEGLEILREVAQDKEAPPSSRVSAASKIVELGTMMYDLEEVVSKLAEIEKRMLDEA